MEFDDVQVQCALISLLPRTNAISKEYAANFLNNILKRDQIDNDLMSLIIKLPLPLLKSSSEDLGIAINKYLDFKLEFNDVAATIKVLLGVFDKNIESNLLVKAFHKMMDKLEITQIDVALDLYDAITKAAPHFFDHRNVVDSFFKKIEKFYQMAIESNLPVEKKVRLIYHIISTVEENKACFKFLNQIMSQIPVIDQTYAEKIYSLLYKDWSEKIYTFDYFGFNYFYLGRFKYFQNNRKAIGKLMNYMLGTYLRVEKLSRKSLETLIKMLSSEDPSWINLNSKNAIQSKDYLT